MEKTKAKRRVVNDPNQFWMIRRKSDGFYSKGGDEPRFSKDGKVFSTHGKLMGHLKHVQSFLNHRNRFAPMPHPHPYEDCEIIQCRRVEEAVCDVIGYGE